MLEVAKNENETRGSRGRWESLDHDEEKKKEAPRRTRIPFLGTPGAATRHFERGRDIGLKRAHGPSVIIKSSV